MPSNFSQVRISDIGSEKTDALTANDYLVVDNLVTNTTQKISKSTLFSINNFDEISTEVGGAANNLAKTNGDGLINRGLVDIERHEHFSETFGATVNKLYTLDSSLASFNILLPSNALDGDRIFFSDWAGACDVKPVILISASGHTILFDSFLELDIAKFSVGIVFNQNNWSLT